MTSLKKLSLIFPIISAALFVGCDDGFLRGRVEKSTDGKTYLAVVDDNGGHCGPLTVDGKIWPYKINEVGPITPGGHVIDCGGSISFTVPAGVIFKFDYWGP